jgi:hypothetical protein
LKAFFYSRAILKFFCLLPFLFFPTGFKTLHPDSSMNVDSIAASVRYSGAGGGMQTPEEKKGAGKR